MVSSLMDPGDGILHGAGVYTDRHHGDCSQGCMPKAMSCRHSTFPPLVDPQTTVRMYPSVSHRVTWVECRSWLSTCRTHIMWASAVYSVIKERGKDGRCLPTPPRFQSWISIPSFSVSSLYLFLMVTSVTPATSATSLCVLRSLHRIEEM